MNELIDFCILLLLIAIVVVLFFNKKTMSCTDSTCRGTMESFIYVGDGDGPAPDHIHYKCRTCGKEHYELQ